MGGERTGLMAAAWKGHTQIAKLLLEKGADVNQGNNDGQTPLDLADNKPEIAKLLRKHKKIPRY